MGILRLRHADSLDLSGSFELWSVVAMLSYVWIGLSWRPVGQSNIMRYLQYGIPAVLVSHPWGEVRTDRSTFETEHAALCRSPSAAAPRIWLSSPVCF